MHINDLRPIVSNIGTSNQESTLIHNVEDLDERAGLSCLHKPNGPAPHHVAVHIYSCFFFFFKLLILLSSASTILFI